MNSIALDTNFERNKNLKALAITIAICLLLFLFFLLKQWSLPTIPPPLADEGIEVNLGNSETGLGSVAPQAIDDPSINENNSTPQNSSQPVEPTQQMDEKGDEVINATPNPVVPKPTVKPVVPVVKAPVKPIVNPTPKPVSPKALFPNGVKKDNGGNNSNVDNGFKDYGKSEGKGVEGKPFGVPNGTGNGISIKSGLNGRKVAVRPTFQDDFTENAKVYVDVTVDANGKVLSAVVNPRGTTTVNQNIRRIATTKALQIKFTAGTEEQSGTISFDFKVTN